MKNLFVILFIGLLLTGCKIEDNEDKQEDNYVEEYNQVVETAQESVRIRSVEAYINAIETTIASYMILEVSSEAPEICSKECTDSCVIDATKESKETGTVTCTGAKKAVLYAGSSIICDSIKYDYATGIVTVAKCIVDDDINNTYSGNIRDGVTKDQN